MTNEQTAADRIRKFIDEYKKMRGLHSEIVYEIHAGDDHRHAAITIADLEALLAQPEPENADHASLDIEHKLQEARDEEFRACRRWLSRNVEMGGNLSDAICIARRDERYWNDLRQ